MTTQRNRYPLASDLDQQKKPQNETTSTATWTRRLVISLTILVWIVFAVFILWILWHFIGTVILIILSSLIAYAIFPLVKFFERVMPRWLAVTIVYVLILGALAGFIYFVIQTAASQVSSLVALIQDMLQHPNNNRLTPILNFLSRIGITPTELRTAAEQFIGQLQGLVSNITLILSSIFNIVLDVIVIAVLSIYFIIHGSHVTRWVRTHAPMRIRGRVNFVLDTLRDIVGGYIRGDLLLATLIGVLVGGGMYGIGVPFAVLLGVLAFLFEFIPIIGTLVSGIICVLLALTQGWLVALITLAYFLLVHTIEAYIVGPRIIGKSIRLHPAFSLIAVIAGAEVYGILGALLGSPIAGVIQAFVIAFWIDWRKAHPDQFPQQPEHADDMTAEQNR